MLFSFIARKAVQSRYYASVGQSRTYASVGDPDETPLDEEEEDDELLTSDLSDIEELDGDLSELSGGEDDDDEVELQAEEEVGEENLPFAEADINWSDASDVLTEDDKDFLEKYEDGVIDLDHPALTAISPEEVACDPEVIDYDQYMEEPPIVTNAHTRLLMTGGMRPLLRESTKETMYQMYKEDPEANTIESLAVEYGVRKERVEAILRLKAEEKRVEAETGQPLDGSVVEALERMYETVESYQDDPLELNEHYPTAPTYSFVDGELNQRRASQRLAKAKNYRRKKYVPPEEIPRIPTPNIPPPEELDPGLAAGLKPPRTPMLFTNWDTDVNPIEQFAIIHEPDGRVRTPTFAERVKYLFRPMYNLLPDHFRLPENEREVKAAPVLNVETPPDLVDEEELREHTRDWQEVVAAAADKKQPLDEVLEALERDPLVDNDDALNVAEVASMLIDADDEEFIRRFEQTDDFTGPEEALHPDDPDDPFADAGDDPDPDGQWIDFGQQVKDTFRSQPFLGSDGPPLPSWMSNKKK